MIEKIKKPKIIDLKTKGAEEIGYLYIASYEEQVPFNIMRTFITQHTPTRIIRGRHAHLITEMILIAVKGKIVVELFDQYGKQYKYKLNSCEYGLYIPPMFWHTMKYSKGAIQLVLCSTQYDENDYIRDYEKFRAT